MASDDKMNLPIPARMRKRREDRGMTGAELARRVGVSPAYISLIETGAKVPRVSKAAEIALALDDEPAVYRAWALASRGGDVGQSLADFERGTYWSSDRDLRRRLRSGEDLTVMRAEMRPASRGHAAEAVVRTTAKTGVESPVLFDTADGRTISVPVLRAGADPGDGPEVPDRLVIDEMLLDRRFIRDEVLERPFAFEATEEATARIPDEAKAGDWVVVTSSVGELSKDAIYLVRLGKRLALGRVVLKGRTLLVLAQDSADTEPIAIGDEGTKPHIAGRVVLVVRRGG